MNNLKLTLGDRIQNISIEEVDRPIVAKEDIQPYQFEPELSDGNSDDGREFASLDGDDDMEHRLGNTNWCNCGNCESMPKAEECICCQELSRVTEKNLNQCALTSMFWKLHTSNTDSSMEKYKRNPYTAYRQLARWCWGYLEKSVRVHLPACATHAIRNKFPSNQYKGFEEA
ncbi:unnamed protein product [Mytilus coruscus]|uniref:P2X purinoreceptor 7 intracellular domain-containing protein n=1 Tax=Mytilus coruscus TaxID=42192 RepID=A0A6J8DJZ6_MYTCO|nr:unnamed protein product [Mytilus coruscus]